MKLLNILNSTRKDKKLMAVFDIDGLIKKVHFGSKNSQTYLDHNDDLKKSYYIKRHKALGTEDLNNPLTPASLSMYILWNKKTLPESIKSYTDKFFKKKMIGSGLFTEIKEFAKELKDLIIEKTLKTDPKQNFNYQLKLIDNEFQQLFLMLEESEKEKNEIIENYKILLADYEKLEADFKKLEEEHEHLFENYV